MKTKLGRLCAIGAVVCLTCWAIDGQGYWLHGAALGGLGALLDSIGGRRAD